MRLASFTIEGRQTWGVADGEAIADVGALLGTRYPTLKALIEAGAYGEAAAVLGQARRLDLDAVTWNPVIPNPGKILCVGHNYETHRQETGRAKVDHPSIFTRFADTLIGQGGGAVLPLESTMFDYEGELAVVIGKAGHRISRESALGHIAGYSCFNDISVRDWQWHTSQFTPGKNFPATGAFGPWLVTADDIPDPTTLSITTRLNGETVQSQPTSDMIFDIPAIIAYVSSFTALSVGDVIATGTPGGVGAKREPPVWMKGRDIIEVEIPGVGCLQNPIVAEGEV